MSDRSELTRLLAEKSVRHGSFTLASGRESNLYIDARLTTMSPEGLVAIGASGLEMIRARGWDADSVGGLTLGADPIAYAISYASFAFPPAIRAFTVRKEPKKHGTLKRIEGPFQSGDRVVVVEDVITSGESALQAVAAVREAGGVVTAVLALVDRNEGGRARLESTGLEVASLVLLSDIDGTT